MHGVCMDVINYLRMPMHGVCVCVCVCVCMCAISSYACLEERETMLNMQVEGKAVAPDVHEFVAAGFLWRISTG